MFSPLYATPLLPILTTHIYHTCSIYTTGSVVADSCVCSGLCMLLRCKRIAILDACASVVNIQRIVVVVLLLLVAYIKGTGVIQAKVMYNNMAKTESESNKSDPEKHNHYNMVHKRT